MTVRQDLRDRAILELNTDVPDGVPETTKRRYVPGAVIKEAQLAAFFGQEESTRVGGAGGVIAKRTMTLAIQGAVVVEDPADADDAMEPLLQHIISKLGNTNLNRLATDVEEVDTLWASSNIGGLFVLVALMRWRIQYQSQKADISSKQ